MVKSEKRFRRVETIKHVEHTWITRISPGYRFSSISQQVALVADEDDRKMMKKNLLQNLNWEIAKKLRNNSDLIELKSIKRIYFIDHPVSITDHRVLRKTLPFVIISHRNSLPINLINWMPHVRQIRNTHFTVDDLQNGSRKHLPPSGQLYCVTFEVNFVYQFKLTQCGFVVACGMVNATDGRWQFWMSSRRRRISKESIRSLSLCAQ